MPVDLRVVRVPHPTHPYRGLLTILHDVDGFESNRHTACMKMRGSVLSLSYTFPHPPEDTRKRKKNGSQEDEHTTLDKLVLQRLCRAACTSIAPQPALGSSTEFTRPCQCTPAPFFNPLRIAPRI